MTAPAGALPGVLLPPEARSAAVARRHVRAVLEAAGLEAVLDEALLVVTELVTNAVVHAGTEVEVHLRAEHPGLWLEVVDHLPGVAPLLRPADEEREGGRGMFLLDAMAREWGTAYRPGGKAIWCRLFPEGAEDPGPAEGLLPVSDARTSAAPVDLAWLLELAPDLERRLPARLVVRELLDRLCEVLGVETAHVLAVLEPGAEPEATVVRGRPPTDEEVLASTVALQVPARVTELGAQVLLPLLDRSGPVGAVVLVDPPPLSAASRAVARVVADRLALLVADQLGERRRQRDRGALALLAEASDLFAESLDGRLSATLTTQLVVPRFGAWAALLTLQEQGTRLDALTCRDEDQTALLQAALSSRAGRALTDAVAARLDLSQPLSVEPGPVLAAHAGALVALPLVARRRLLGVLLVGGRRRTPPADATLLLDLARRAALAMDNARQYEESTAVARALQESLLPASLPSSPQIAVGARYAAAGERNEVGGDFYDVFTLPGGGFGLAIGDVCGKGPEAAAITGLARQVLRLSLRDGHGLVASFQRLNDSLLELEDRGRFLTSAAALVHPHPEGLDVRLASAGHPLPALVGAGGVRFVGAAGDLLGVMPAVQVVETELLLRPGQSLVFYTDGVTERRDGDVQFGDSALVPLLAEHASARADVLAQRVQEGVQAFSRSEARDDLAVLVLQVGQGGRPVAALAGEVLERA